MSASKGIVEFAVLAWSSPERSWNVELLNIGHSVSQPHQAHISAPLSSWSQSTGLQHGFPFSCSPHAGDSIPSFPSNKAAEMGVS